MWASSIYQHIRSVLGNQLGYHRSFLFKIATYKRSASHFFVKVSHGLPGAPWKADSIFKCQPKLMPSNVA